MTSKAQISLVEDAEIEEVNGKLPKSKTVVLTPIKTHRKRWIAIVVVVVILAGLGWFLTHRSSAAPQYQTSQAITGTLITSVSASGQITDANSVPVNANVTGTVKDVYVKNGDTVTAGQKIADITLDDSSLQKQAAAYVSLLNAINAKQSAQQNQLSLQTQVTQDQKAVYDAQTEVDAMNNGDGINPQTHVAYTDLEKQSIQASLTIAQQNLTLAQEKYSTSGSSITSAGANINSAQLSYNSLSSSITAPAAGVITGLSIYPGYVITTSNGSGSGANASSASNATKIGSVTVGGNLEAVVDLSEIDASKVQDGQKATLTIDAFPDKTFTGKVVSIDTTGAVSSGVTSYPATISLDTALNTIYPNMGVTATITTNVKDNVLLVPNSAVQTSIGTSTVRVMKNGQIQTENVEIGDASDTQTEITSGLSNGDTVVTAVINPTTASFSSGSSPFGLKTTTGGGGGFGGGGAVFRTGGGGRGG